MKTPSSILAFGALAASVQGHGYISMPKATYEPNTIYTTYNALTTASVNKGFNGGHYNWSPTQNAQAFNDHWNATGYKSLRDMLDPIAPDYGHSLKTATPVDVSDYTEMWWQNDEYKEGFIASHEGPCEAWIDDVMVFHHDNCAAQFKSYPAKVPADYSSCKGDCLFVFYWLALHEPNWQIYKQCVPITNSGSGASPTKQSSGADDTSASKDDGASNAEQQTTTNAPTATTAAPTTDAGASDETQTTGSGKSDATQTEGSTANEASSAEQSTTETTEAPSTTSTTPAPEASTPEAPASTPAPPTTTEAATSSGKCVRRN